MPGGGDNPRDPSVIRHAEGAGSDDTARSEHLQDRPGSQQGCCCPGPRLGAP